MSAEISELTDHELLARYVQKRDGASFSLVVNRYIDLVYTAALRQVGHSHQAEDVTQAVFLILSQRASSITSQIVLPGWLLITTRNVSRNAQVRERRLKNREQKAATMKPEETESIQTAEAISPILDEALANLNEEDRNAIVCRFFQSKSHREVGEALGVSEDAASQRVLRALDKLRTFMARQGVTTSHAVLSAALPLIAVKSAPPALAAAVSGGLSGVSCSVAAIAKPVLGGKTVSAALIGWGSAAALAVAVTTGVIIVQNQKSTSQTVAPASQPLAPPLPVVQAPPATKLTVTLIDPTTKLPLADAEVQYSSAGNRQQWLKAGADGKVDLPLPNQNQYVQIYARAPGRVQSRITYNTSPIRGDNPGEMSFPLEQGIVIGGTVVDAQGNPIPEAKVQFGVYSQERKGAPEPTFDNIEIITDAEGHWSFEQAPKDLSQLSIYATHPTISNSSSSLRGSADDLKSEQAKIIVSKSDRNSYTRSGDVVDESGKPIAGARVLWYYSRYQSEKPVAMTDDQGKFVVNSKESESSPMTIVATGYGPEVVTQQEIYERKPIHIVMKRPRTIEGTIVDHTGNPIRGAAVTLGELADNAQALEWNVRTDENGHFVWNDAPQYEFKLNITLKNKSSLTNFKVPPKSGPLNLTLYPQLELIGTVVDAKTKQPIPSFKMDYGIRWPGQEDVTWQSQNSRPIANGKFNATLGDFSNGGKLRVQAEGYLPSTSRLIEAKEGAGGKVTINFELVQGTGPAGTILSPDGKPVADVDVILLPKDFSYSIDLDNPGRNARGHDGTDFTKTDANGQFYFQPNESEHTLFVSCREGFILQEGVKDGFKQEIKLGKWATIDGTVRRNASVGSGVEVYATMVNNQLQETRFYFNSIPTSVADKEGHFSFDRLPPGAISIGRAYVFNNGTSRAFMGGKTIEVKAGEKKTLNLGGVGRPVAGKIILPPEIAEKVRPGSNLFMLHANSQMKSTFNPYDVVEFPIDYPDWDNDKRRKWQDEMLKKPKLRALMMAMQQNQETTSINFQIYEDGSFQSDDVTPGSYVFDLDLREPWRGNQTQPNESLGIIHGEFTVPEKPACPNDEILNIGEFSLKQAASRFAVGTQLPQIPLMDVEGKAFDYNAYRGKIMVFHVWHLDGNDTYVASRELEQKYKDDSQVVIVHVGTETLPAWAKRVAEREKWLGINVVGRAEFYKQYDPGEWVPWACNFNAPSYLIIDQEGKLAGHTSDPVEIEKIVAGIRMK